MSKTVLEPMGDFLLVIDIPQKNVIGEISLPDNQRQQEMMFGFVVTVGPDCVMLIKPQEKICYGPYAGKTILIEGVEFRLLRLGQIEGRLVTTD